jgi:hypothetical protein
MTCIHPGCTEDAVSGQAQYCARHRSKTWIARRWRAKQRGEPVGTDRKPCRTCGAVFILMAPNQQYCALHSPPKRVRTGPPRVRKPKRVAKPAYVIPHPPHLRAINQLLREWRCVP